MNTSRLTKHDWLQVDQAYRGCVSGTLKEWPHLRHAFKKAGLNLLPSVGALEMQQAAFLLKLNSEEGNTESSILGG